MNERPEGSGPQNTPNAWLRDLHVAALTLTRLPLPTLPAEAMMDPRARRTFPIMGALVGLAAGGVFFAGTDVGLPVTVNAVLAIAALILIGGHLERGDAHATVPFMVGTLFKIAALAMIGADDADGTGPHMVVLALVTSGALSNAAALLLEPPNPEEPDPAKSGAVMTGALIAVVAAVLLEGFIAGPLAVGGALFGAWIGPKSMSREIDSGQLSLPVVVQQSAEIWALMAIALTMRV